MGKKPTVGLDFDFFFNLKRINFDTRSIQYSIDLQIVEFESWFLFLFFTINQVPEKDRLVIILCL